MKALIWQVRARIRDQSRVKRRSPGLAPSLGGSGGSRAANPYDAPRKHRFSIAAKRGNRKASGWLPIRLQGRLTRPRPGRISRHGRTGRNIPRDHAASADQRAVTDGDSGQDDGTAADPDVAADPDRAAEFQPGAPGRGVARVVGGIDLHRGPDLGAIADHDLDDVEDHAIEIEEHAVAEADIAAVVAAERRADHGIL